MTAEVPSEAEELVRDDTRGHRGRPWTNRTHCLRGHEYTPENTVAPSLRKNLMTDDLDRQKCNLFVYSLSLLDVDENGSPMTSTSTAWRRSPTHFTQSGPLPGAAPRPKKWGCTGQ